MENEDGVHQLRGQNKSKKKNSKNNGIKSKNNNEGDDDDDEYEENEDGINNNMKRRKNKNNKNRNNSNNENEYDGEDNDENYDNNNNIRNKGNKYSNNQNNKNKKYSKYENDDDKNNNMDSKHKVYYKGITINKFSLMYFCSLITHYMKKKNFSICARQIANYQKYLEIKYSLKILFRLMLKRIIFYKIKFMHRYKKINKYLIKNKIKSINDVYKKNKNK